MEFLLGFAACFAIIGTIFTYMFISQYLAKEQEKLHTKHDEFTKDQLEKQQQVDKLLTELKTSVGAIKMKLGFDTNNNNWGSK